MSNFRTIDRETRLLLPPSVDERLPENVVEVVEGLDLRATDAWSKLIDQPWRIMSLGVRDWAYRS
jgi:hypothetical protein